MHPSTDYQREHVLTLIETAARNGRSEREIVQIVEQYFGKGNARVAERRPLVDWLLSRKKAA